MNKKLLLISFILALIISLVPIPRTMRNSFECPRGQEELCFNEYPTHGFPFVIAKTDPWNSPSNVIDWDIITVIIAICLFPLNWAIYFALLKSIELIYKRLGKSKKRRGDEVNLIK